MFKIQPIEDYPLQTKVLSLPDGSQVTMTLYFIEMQRSWFIRVLTYADFEANYIKVVNSPNLLRQFRNIIPFGLACNSQDNRDPMFRRDFLTDACSLFLLSESEVQAYEDYLSGS